MRADLHEIAASFDTRAPRYLRGGWHQLCAERLVALSHLRPGGLVLDAATGTGLAALAAVRAVGSAGHVTGVDISAGMLRAAKVADEPRLTNVEFVQADACNLPHYSETFDAVTCAAGLLYMAADDALREWHRVLKTGGIVGFSTMHGGSPPGGRIFRECAAAFGIRLQDPCEPLGSVAASRRALTLAGFEVVEIVDEFIEFSAQDHALAWESNFGSIAYADVRRLDEAHQHALREMYIEALEREQRRNPDALNRASILYAIARKPGA
jgi:ubiquinone/menaquinone biosynthesis C-methylase UbiE